MDFVPQILQIVAMVFGLLVGGVIEHQPAGYEGQQYFDEFKFDAFLHFLDAQYIAERLLNVFALMHAQTGIGLTNAMMMKEQKKKRRKRIFVGIKILMELFTYIYYIYIIFMLICYNYN